MSLVIFALLLVELQLCKDLIGNLLNFAFVSTSEDAHAVAQDAQKFSTRDDVIHCLP